MLSNHRGRKLHESVFIVSNQRSTEQDVSLNKMKLPKLSEFDIGLEASRNTFSERFNSDKSLWLTFTYFLALNFSPWEILSLRSSLS